MSVNPGFGGQKLYLRFYLKSRIKKIQSEKNIDFDIEIDGGIILRITN